MNIAKHIQDLLYRYECVILPGFGAFLSQKQSAHIDEDTQSFHPPKKTVSFNRQLQKNDGLLANYIAEAEKVSYSNSVYAISEFAASLEKSLEEDKQADLANIGKFILSSEGTLAFEPYDKVNYFTDSFGLDSFQAGVVNREVYKKQVEEIEEKTPFLFTPERRKSSYLKYAAVGIIALGLSGLAGLNIYSDQVSKHNIAEQQEAEGQLQQQIQQATFIIDNPLPAITFNVDKQSGNYHIVAGAFRIEENAAKKVDELRAEGHKARLIGANKYGLHQVVYSSHQTRRDAINMLREVKKSNESAWLLIQEL
ncbi:SPOR domain-containing protein [Salegentibacter sp. F188]|uniref:SPOR domain-containing protein n=1 Tax=Autumnicola patrickiae TaxID=3075591 RepID=A0ABU3E1T9_9FLAO|nr:SPOR domain-containing protein [Salegentibacter sp. F188]MDT0689654.1 SPOR domain-containing protein [Salegentibacter sp. F188]